MSSLQKFLHRSHHIFGLSLKKRAFVFALAIIPLGSLQTGIMQDTTTDLTLTEVSAQTDTVLQLDEPIVFTFEEKQDADTLVVTMTPERTFTSSWSDAEQKLTITPDTTWTAATEYTVSLTPRGSADATQRPSVFFTFITVAYPQVINDTTALQKKIIHAFAAGKPASIAFDRDLSAFDVRAIVRGAGSVTHTVDAAQKTLTLAPDKAVAAGSGIDITLFIKHHAQGERAYVPVMYLTFKMTPQEPQVWPEDTQERLALAQNVTQPRITAGKYIDINLTSHITSLFSDGLLVRQFINSPGAEDTPTPTGRFRVENKGAKPLSRMFGVYLPYWVAFTKDGKYGIHDLIEWPVGHPDHPAGGKESLVSIDKAVSPGCVRHDDADSKAIYNWADIGTPIIIRT